MSTFVNNDALNFLTVYEIDELNEFISEYRKGAFASLPSNYKDIIGTDKAHTALNLKYLHKQIKNCIPEFPDSILSGSDIDRAFADSIDDTVALETVSCLNVQNILLGRSVSKTDTEYIKSYFGESRVLSSGQNGVALVTNFDRSQTSFVIKAMRRFDDKSLTDQMNEYNIGTYAINKLRSEIPNFAFMFGAFTCSGPRYSDSGQKLDILTICENSDDPVLYTIQERVVNSIPLSTFFDRCTRSDALNVLVQIFAALYMAENRYNFTHNDLHTGNILISSLQEPIVIRYDLGGDEPFIIKTQYVAVIIDLGMSYAEVVIDGEKVTFSPRGREASFITSDRPRFEADIYKLGFSLWLDYTPIARTLIQSGPRKGLMSEYMETSDYPNYTKHLDIIYEVLHVLNPSMILEHGVVYLDVVVNDLYPNGIPALSAPYPYVYTDDVYDGEIMVRHLFDSFGHEFNFKIQESEIGDLKVFGCAHNQSCLNQIDANLKYTSPASRAGTLEVFMHTVENHGLKPGDNIPLSIQQIAIDHHVEYLTKFSKEFNFNLQDIWAEVKRHSQIKLVTVTEANIEWYLRSPSRIDDLLRKMDDGIFLMDQIERLQTKARTLDKFTSMFGEFFSNNLTSYNETIAKSLATLSKVDASLITDYNSIANEVRFLYKRIGTQPKLKAIVKSTGVDPTTLIDRLHDVFHAYTVTIKL